MAWFRVEISDKGLMLKSYNMQIQGVLTVEKAMQISPHLKTTKQKAMKQGYAFRVTRLDD